MAVLVRLPLLRLPWGRAPYESSQYYPYQQQDRLVAIANIRRQAAHALYGRGQHARPMWRQSGNDPSFRIDRGRDACIRGGHHRPSGLDAAQPPDLQMLAKRPGLAEPSEVAQVHEHARAGSCAWGRQERREQLGTENILVANVERQMLIIHREWSLDRGSTIEVTQRHFQHPREPLEPSRYIFAPGHEVVLVVA